VTTALHNSPTVPALGEGARAAPPAGALAWLSGGLTAALGAVGVALGLSVIFGEPRQLRIGWLLPLVGVRLDLDPLGGLFLVATGAVSIAVGIYAVGYAQRERWARFPLAILPLFVAGMLLVPAAGSITICGANIPISITSFTISTSRSGARAIVTIAISLGSKKCGRACAFCDR